jgi:hypothetical protein
MLSRNYSGGKPCQIAAALMEKVSAFDFSYFDVSRLPLDTFLGSRLEIRAGSI